jgi:2-haloacid dehalogenase
VNHPRTLVFDVNETLLDLGAIEPAFTSVFGSAEPMSEWFARMLHGSLVANATNRYRPFGLIGTEALVTLAQRRGVDLDPDRAVAIVAEMRRLPAHPDVPAALERLRAGGFRLVTLTNGSSDTAAAQLDHAGIAQYFERALSVDAIRQFKPAPAVYLHATAVLGVDVDQALMIAAHDWDIIGARSVGMPGAYLARPGAVWGMPDDPPDVVAFDLQRLADALLGEQTAPEPG